MEQVTHHSTQHCSSQVLQDITAEPSGGYSWSWWGALKHSPAGMSSAEPEWGDRWTPQGIPDPTQKGSWGPSCGLCYGWSIQLSSWRCTRAPRLAPPACPPREALHTGGQGSAGLALLLLKVFHFVPAASCEDRGCWANRELGVGTGARGFKRWREEKLPSTGIIRAQHWCHK